MHSPDMAQENIARIRELFPNCVTESHDGNGELTLQVDFDLLRQELSDSLVEGPQERYRLDWPGKRQALLTANAPIAKTLRPCREESVDFDTTENLFIEGDNLDALKLLQESYLGKVKMIYIDPPYNTGNDFIYEDDFSENTKEYFKRSNQKDENDNHLALNKEVDGRFHSKWLTMMYPRLKLARTLLRDDGAIFINIDDHESHNMRKLCDEIFGANCFVSASIWRSSDNSNNDAKQFSNDHNITLIYSRQPLWQPQKLDDETKRTHFKNPDNDPRGAWFDGNPLNSPNYRENLIYDLISPNGTKIAPPKNGWRWSKETMQDKIASGEIRFTEDGTNIRRRTYLCDMTGLPPSSLWIDLEQTGHNRQAKYELMNLMPEDVFDTPKPVKLIKFIINLINDCRDVIIMDFFSGSGTTAHATMQCNADDGGKRKYILVQLPENLDDNLIKATNDKKQILKNAIALCDNLKVPHVLSKVTIERIRRAGIKIKADNADKNGIQNLDIGFRVLKVDSSCMEDVYYTPDQIDQKQLTLFAANIKADRRDKPEDLLYQVLIDWGVELHLPIKPENIQGKKVFFVDENALVACFDSGITEVFIQELAKHKPLRVVFRDAGFASDAARINAEQIFKQLSPSTEVKVI